MINFIEAKINTISIHRVGNKLNEDGIVFSKSTFNKFESIDNLLTNYFLNSFQSNEYFNFYHESDLDLNEVFVYVAKIFDNSTTLYEQSVNLAKHLYEQSTHPKIKGGEFYTVYFKDCVIDGCNTDAVGLFKSENKDTFLKVYPSSDGFDIESEKGVNINRLDKGCLIFNTEKENGYIVAVVDNTNKGPEARYWIDGFLHLRQRKDEYHNTQNLLSLCKNFVTKELPKQFEFSKADQVDILNKSVQFFKENEIFEMENFTEKVIGQSDLINSFNNFKTNFQKDREIEIADSFTISEPAVKKQARSIRSVIKLDRNFHIYVHGNRNLIEQGIDEHGRKYYKIYYNEEA